MFLQQGQLYEIHGKMDNSDVCTNEDVPLYTRLTYVQIYVYLYQYSGLVTSKIRVGLNVITYFGEQQKKTFVSYNRIITTLMNAHINAEYTYNDINKIIIQIHRSRLLVCLKYSIN